MIRRPSPPVCLDCLRVHLRLARDERLARRAALTKAVEWEDPITRIFAEQLFDHLTLGQKVAEGQASNHPAPPIPRAWVAEELDERTRLIVRHVYALPPKVSRA